MYNALTPVKQPPVKTVVSEQKITPKVATPVKKVIKASASNHTRRTSALSFKGLKEQKIAEASKQTIKEDTSKLPTDAFEPSQVKELWNTYIEKLLTQGKKSMASIMKMNDIMVKGNKIHLELPNSLVASQLQMSQTPLLEFIKEHLNNYSISLIIDINEEITKKTAYTKLEKFEKLKEKNPTIDLLRKTFYLDV